MKKTHSFFDIKDKVVILTGGAGFLAKYFARGLLLARTKLILTDVNSSLGKKRVQELKKIKKGEVSFYPADITREEAIKKLLQLTLKKYKKVDILINNAAAKRGHVSLKDWHRALAVDLTGVRNCIEIIGRSMIKKSGGIIINIGSIYGIVSPKFSIYPLKSRMETPSVYSAAKAGVINLTRHYACLWAKYNVRVNCLSPGGVFHYQDSKFIKNYSQQVPMKRMAKPEEIVGPLLFLCSEASSYITGANLVVDGGWTAW